MLGSFTGGVWNNDVLAIVLIEVIDSSKMLT